VTRTLRVILCEHTVRKHSDFEPTIGCIRGVSNYWFRTKSIYWSSTFPSEPIIGICSEPITGCNPVTSNNWFKIRIFIDSARFWNFIFSLSSFYRWYRLAINLTFLISVVALNSTISEHIYFLMLDERLLQRNQCFYGHLNFIVWGHFGLFLCGHQMWP
jgi:hypothetical protein